MANLQTLQDLATLISMNQQANAQQDTGPKMIVAGGRVMGRDVSQPSGMQNAMTSLGSLATNFIRMQQLQKRNQFFSEANKVMGSAVDVEEKKNLMRQLIMQHNGDDYGLGIKDALWKDMTEPKKQEKWQPSTREEALDFEREKAKTSISAQKFAMQEEEAKKAAEAQAKNEQDFTQDMLDTIGEVKKGIKYFGAAGVVPPLPGEYSKTNWLANFNKLLSKRVLETMTQLKKASKTGATGFGQLSEKELAVLQDASTVLKKNMSEKDAMRYLTKMENALMKISSKQISTSMPEQANVLTATNPRTGKKIQSTDGGKTWQPL